MSLLILFTGISDLFSQIALNQFGYETESPKRFTAVGVKDNTPFTVRAKNEKKALFKGKVQGEIGDFSAFTPQDTQQEYVVEIAKENLLSHPFFIKKDLYLLDYWQLAVDYMIDVRSVVGTHPSAYGGSPWRDGTYYSYEVPSLIALYRANPARVEEMSRQIDYEAEKAKVLNPDFFYDRKNPQSEGVLEAVRRYYTELEGPTADAPDIVKLIHWGLGFYLMKPYTKDPSNDPLPKQLHSQNLEQFAHFLYAYEELKLDRWIPKSFYERCYSFALSHWKAVGSFEIDPLWMPHTYEAPFMKDGQLKLPPNLHPFKGRHVPGHSILPNLYMYKILKVKAPYLADPFLEAAKKQTQFIIDSLDWNNPMTTKGHRGSEFQMMINLVWFLQHMPEHAPEGLVKKIEAWAEVAISRSKNKWDFRRYDMKDNWTIPSMNETGNLAGFPAAALSASWVIKKPELKNRLVQLAFSQLDNLYGRNPQFAAACNRPHMGYPYIEKGWPKSYKDDVCARLETVRGSLDASPGTEKYLKGPEGKFRHPEGWVNWNASLNVSLAYLEFNKHPSVSYELVWAEEFEGEKLDESKWAYRTDNKHRSKQLKENVSLSEGSLKLSLRSLDKALEGKLASGAGIVTKERFHYGYYETRAKLGDALDDDQDGKTDEGWHHAFWAMAANVNEEGEVGTTYPAERRTEIDGFENPTEHLHETDVNGLGTFVQHVIIWDEKGKEFGRRPKPPADRTRPANFDPFDWHTYGFEWTPEQIIFYVDGQITQIADYPADSFTHDQLNVWLTAIAANWNKDDQEDSQALYDYFRFYKKKM